MKRFMLLLVLSIFLISCGPLDAILDSTQSTISAPDEFLGEFYCSGHERGMLAHAGNLSLRDDGTVALEWIYASSPLAGTWRYDAAGEQLIFSNDLEISHALYDDAVDQLEVHLREGVEQAHVETGVMYCQKQ